MAPCGTVHTHSCHSCLSSLWFSLTHISLYQIHCYPSSLYHYISLSLFHSSWHQIPLFLCLSLTALLLSLSLTLPCCLSISHNLSVTLTWFLKPSLFLCTGVSLTISLPSLVQSTSFCTYVSLPSISIFLFYFLSLHPSHPTPTSLAWPWVLRCMECASDLPMG